MTYLVCLLEEPSAKEMLRKVLPKILPQDICVRYVVFEGKQDLEKQIVRRLMHWQEPETVFLVMRDQDAGECKRIKNDLIQKVAESGRLDVTVVRIACHELESFYLGDLAAVEKGLAINGLSKQQRKEKFREPDLRANAAEELAKLTKRKYQKVSGSRAIASFLKTDGSNKSRSFNVLLDGIRRLIGLNKAI